MKVTLNPNEDIVKVVKEALKRTDGSALPDLSAEWYIVLLRYI